ncbi:MAG: DUF4390 domain-containing protein [Gammaproteobacteria bacterium]|jgi:hypothetical protein|nr:DUF4390 domain-containing protein [Gammaproteobacteria bacterium]MDP6617535.1 DUF4390 domain-containing protein [Gammaproteobacteria bacterium]MDP6694412.1 DUF4390 domain-containing protein [Gammaproteobacteria bacterium]MDP7041165.1 DUF4390 domain-containing protein [Gammaproteobacteria bacterium]
MKRSGGWRATLALGLLFMLMLPGVSAAGGRFEVISASSRLDNNYWLVDARLDLLLSDEAIEALENGVTLRIQLQYEVHRVRRFWVDETVSDKNQNIELQYLSLGQRYVVRDLTRDKQSSYATLYSALRSLSQIKDFYLIKASKLDPEQSYWMSMRVVLDQEELPGPLQMLAFWQGDFSLESEWYKWIPR